MAPSLEEWPIKTKEAPSPHEVRLTPMDINPVFECLRKSIALFCSSIKTQRNLKYKHHSHICLSQSSHLFILSLDKWTLFYIVMEL